MGTILYMYEKSIVYSTYIIGNRQLFSSATYSIRQQPWVFEDDLQKLSIDNV